jgi:hypothetical protein
MFLWYLPIKFPHGLSGVAETSLKSDDAPKIIKLVQIYPNNTYGLPNWERGSFNMALGDRFFQIKSIY